MTESLDQLVANKAMIPASQEETDAEYKAIAESMSKAMSSRKKSTIKTSGILTMLLCC